MSKNQPHWELTAAKRKQYSFFMKKMALKLMVLVMFASLTSACTSKQTVTLTGDGSGTASFRFEIKKLFAEFFVSADESKGKSEIFDVAKIKKGIEKRPGFTVRRIATPTPESLEVDVAFKDIRALFDDDGADDPDGIVTLTEKSGQKRFGFHLERKSAKQISSLFAGLLNPAFQEMSPRRKRISSEKEYLDAIGFMVGNEGPALMKSSYIEITMKVDGEIISQSGGTLTNGAAVFRIPLLHMMLLEKPLDYSVTFSPARKTAQKGSPKSK